MINTPLGFMAPIAAESIIFSVLGVCGSASTMKSPSPIALRSSVSGSISSTNASPSLLRGSLRSATTRMPIAFARIAHAFPMSPYPTTLIVFPFNMPTVSRIHSPAACDLRMACTFLLNHIDAKMAHSPNESLNAPLAFVIGDG